MNVELCTNGPLATCDLHFGRITLAETLARFQCEAVRGECDTGHYRCPYYVWGQGPPLVFVPGLADDSKSFVMPIALLSQHFRCVAYDWPTGLGDGAHLARYRHATFVDDLLALLDHIGAGQAFVLGYSFGSTVTLGAMHSQPARIPRAVLLGGFARRPLAPAEVLLASLARYWKGPMQNLPLHDWVLHVNQACGFGRRDPAVWDYFLEHSRALPMAALARRALLLHQTDLRRMLPAIQQPTLLVCGETDPLVNKRCEMELLTGLPNVIRVELAGCGHQAIYTHPEALAEAVCDFLQGGWRLLVDGFTSAGSADGRLRDDATVKRPRSPASAR
jgi:pimeloyl-ACP methyl ester carboxylesterase